MADRELLEVLKQGPDQWNQWREQHRERYIDLYEADLSGVRLSEAELSRANLSRANLRQANLYRANLSEADLREADLREANLLLANLREANLRLANLREASLYRADLHKANLHKADLSRSTLVEANLRESVLSEANLSEVHLHGVDLSNSDLEDANLSGAAITGTVFAALDLSTVKGLVEIHHLGPSRVELYTVEFPQDGSALHFLRGAGVPEEWIDFWRSTSQHPIQYHSLFISYSSQDDLLARRLHADIQAAGVRCWFAPEDMKIGARMRSTIDQAIHVHEKLLLLSEQAIASTWVETEVEAALDKEQRQQREVLFPIRLDASVLHTKEAWAAQLRRQRHIGDFTGWKDPVQYQQAFARLLHDLKAEKP